VELLQLDGLLALVRVGEMRRLAADHARDEPFAREDLHALAHEHLRVPAARLDDVQEALVRDVAHEQGDLVDVADDDHQRRVAATVHARDRGAELVGGHLVREPLGGFAPHARRPALVPGRAGRGEKVLEQLGRGHRPRG
jgi:hypothetical protein